jgi:MFS family permease
MLFALPGLVAGTAVLLFAREPASTVAPAAIPAPVLAASPHTPKPPLSRRLADFTAPLRHRTIAMLILVSMAAAGGRGVGILTTYLPLYLASLHLDPGTVAALFTLLLAGSVVGPLIGGRLSDRAGRRPLLFASYGLSALVTLALPVLGAFNVPLWAYAVEVAFLGLYAYSESPLLQAYLADVAPHRERDAAFAWYFTLAFGVGSLWGIALGALTDNFGFATTFSVMAASYLVAAAILLFVPRQRTT